MHLLASDDVAKSVEQENSTALESKRFLELNGCTGNAHGIQEESNDCERIEKELALDSKLVLSGAHEDAEEEVAPVYQVKIQKCQDEIPSLDMKPNVELIGSAVDAQERSDHTKTIKIEHTKEEFLLDRKPILKCAVKANFAQNFNADGTIKQQPLADDENAMTTLLESLDENNGENHDETDDENYDDKSIAYDQIEDETRNGSMSENDISYEQEEDEDVLFPSENNAATLKVRREFIPQNIPNVFGETLHSIESHPRTVVSNEPFCKRRKLDNNQESQQILQEIGFETLKLMRDSNGLPQKQLNLVFNHLQENITEQSLPLEDDNTISVQTSKEDLELAKRLYAPNHAAIQTGLAPATLVKLKKMEKRTAILNLLCDMTPKKVKICSDFAQLLQDNLNRSKSDKGLERCTMTIAKKI